jgi:hypothetical protein
MLALAPADAAADFATWLEDLILGRQLTPQEFNQIETKTAYWWAVATAQRDALSRFISRN